MNQAPPRVVRVLVVDPDRWRKKGICSSLLDNGGVQIVEEVDRRRPDVILLAHSLMTNGSIDVSGLRAQFPSAAVLVYGDSDSAELTAELLALGARGYFQLSLSAGALADAVALVSRGKVWSSREAVTLLVDRMAGGKLPANSRSPSGDDMQILTLLNEGLTNKEIAGRLGLAEATVKARLTRLYKHFQVRTRLQLLARAIKDGVVSSRHSVM